MKLLRLTVAIFLAACTPAPTEAPVVVPSRTPATAPTHTAAPTATVQATATGMPQATPLEAHTAEAIVSAPYPDAPGCADVGAAHDNDLFHTLWDGARGCHYDHEHGQNPFSAEVATTFPGFDLQALLGGVGVGHTNPSSSMENTHKHGGFKWDVTLSHSAGCVGREAAPTGVDALVVQYHAFGDYAVEFESRVHSAGGLLRQCQVSNPTDYGYIYVVQHQDYGQRLATYQGAVIPYPDTPVPAYITSREPYFTLDCFGGGAPCDRHPSREAMLRIDNDTNSTWISEPNHVSGTGSPLFFLLFRLRDAYQALDASDLTYPFTFAWMCSGDGGLTFAASPGCRYNNSTTRIHEVGGEIPAEWDNLEGFDTDDRVGRITALGYVTRFGELAPACEAPGPDCHPLKLVQAFTGRYGAGFDLSPDTLAFNPLNLPERDVYFCGAAPCLEFDPGAVSSGWIGAGN